MRHAWRALALALVACHSDAASVDPAQQTAAWCRKEVALDDALGPGCSYATGGSVDVATVKARAAIDHARAAITGCPR